MLKIYFFGKKVKLCLMLDIIHISLVLQELTIFQDSLTTLKMAKGKFAASKEALEQFKDGWDQKTSLIPLTGSMYVYYALYHAIPFIF